MKELNIFTENNKTMKFNIGDRVKNINNKFEGKVQGLNDTRPDKNPAYVTYESGINKWELPEDLTLIERCPPEERPIKDLLKAIEMQVCDESVYINKDGEILYCKSGCSYKISIKSILLALDKPTLSDQTKKDIKDNPEAVLKALKNSNPELFKS